MIKIGFAGTDARSLQGALVVSTAKSSNGNNDFFHGVVIRGTPAMPEFAKRMDWPISFVPTTDNSVGSYAKAIVSALKDGLVDYVVPMPEGLIYEGLVDLVTKAGFGDRIAGFLKAGAFVEGDKIACKRLCRDFNIPTAEWCSVDARDYSAVLRTVLYMIDKHGGAVMKFPLSAAGKGSRLILDAWQIRETWDGLMADYGKDYRAIFGDLMPWPLLIEARRMGVEISFTVPVDKNGNFQFLPSALDYPERFAGRPAGKDNPITGGMNSASPHPMDTKELFEIAGDQIIKPFIRALAINNILRPCILYPGCVISLDHQMRPKRILMYEMNIRPGEPEFQPVARRIRNLGPIMKAMLEGNLDTVVPEVRQDQVSMSIALVTGPGGPDGQKGYPWSCTKGEPMEIDFAYCEKKSIQLIPSAMDYDAEKEIFKSDGTRVIYMNANATVKPGETIALTAYRLKEKLLTAFDAGKVRVIPRENPSGNRLDLRRDVGDHYIIAENAFPTR